MIALEHELPEVAAILKEECAKYKSKQKDVEHRSSYEALRRAAIEGDLNQFVAILKKVIITIIIIYSGSRLIGRRINGILNKGNLL